MPTYHHAGRTADWPRLLAATAAVLTGACSDAPTTAISGAPARAANAVGPVASKATLARARALDELQAAVQGRRLRGAEDEILRLEAETPGGVGGAYVDSATGRFVVLLRDQAQRGRAREALGRLRARLGPNGPAVDKIATDEVDYRSANYAFSELLGWSRVLAADLFTIPSVITLDADERLNRVRVTVTDDSGRAAVERLVAAAGVPAGAVLIELGIRPVLMQTNLTSYVRPLGSGMEIENELGNGSWCSTGWMVQANNGDKGFLTASHCSNSSIGSGRTGESIWQADKVSSDFAGYVRWNTAWTVGCYSSAVSTYFTGPCTSADVMFIGTGDIDGKVPRIAAATSNAVGSRQFPGEPKWYMDIRLPQYAFVGMTANKMGRTTGATQGTVQGTCEDVRYGQGTARDAVETCQDHVINASVGQGDSGGPVYRLIGTTVYPLGTLTGGGPLNASRVEAGYVTVNYCSSACNLWFNEWYNMEAQLGHQFTPIAGGGRLPTS